MRHLNKATAIAALLTLSACGERATLPQKAGWGPHPVLVAPKETILPTIDVPRAVGWKSGEMPTAAPGLKVGAFARGLDHPRWIYVLPNGDVLVAETNAPAKPDDWKGIPGYVAMRLMQIGGSGKGQSPNRVTLLRDTNGDGAADMRKVFVSGLNSPFGMALIGDSFYVADTDAVLRFSYKDGDTSLGGRGEKVIDLPAGTLNHHWTKNLIASPDGAKLYVSVGSNSNAGDNGMAVEKDRAAIWEIDLKTGRHRIYASGLRNPNGMGWRGNTLWVAVNERDEIGSDLVPDYMTAVKDGGFYGWPYSYYGRHVDARVKPERPDLAARAIVPDYALGAHTASLGLAFSNGAVLGSAYQSGVFIGQHGSWNRDPPAGYQVVFIPFRGAEPSGDARVVLSGFLSPQGEARGRPVGVAIDKSGALLVADDVGNTIWRVKRE